jgi:uncharacterized protein YndB with AHSA1/START domain
MGEGMQNLSFSIDIHAPADAVWRVLWDEDTFRDWASTFAPGPRIKADWRQGGRFEFTDSSGHVSYGVIRRLVPGKMMYFEHVGEVKEGSESVYPDGPRREIYKLEQHDGAVRLILEQDVSDEFADIFAELTSRAFARIKELSDSRRSPTG